MIRKCNFFLSPDSFGGLLVLGVWFSHWISVPLASAWTARSRIVWQAEVHLCTSLESGLCEVKACGLAAACYEEVRIDTVHPSAPHSTSDQSKDANKTVCPAGMLNILPFGWREDLLGVLLGLDQFWGSPEASLLQLGILLASVHQHVGLSYSPGSKLLSVAWSIPAVIYVHLPSWCCHALPAMCAGVAVDL